VRADSLIPVERTLDKRRDHCGVIAVYKGTGPAAPLVHRGLFALQHRGQEAAGLVVLDDASGELRYLRGRGLVPVALPKEGVAELPGRSAIGHVRYSTVAVDHAENIQPFLCSTPLGRFAIAHNGHLKNADALTTELQASGALLSTTMDTELFAHLVARSGCADLPSALRYAAGRVVGAYSLTILCNGHLYGLRDPHGVRPLVLGRLDGGGWVIASESCALDAIGARYLREIEPGELVEIGPQGVISTRLLAPAPRPAPCVFELVYFSRPDSRVFGQSVQLARLRMGEELAAQDERSGSLVSPDLVVPVPDSGVAAAMGYARRSGVPFEMAILRSHYVGRTFILPNQDARADSIRLKLSVVAASVAGKCVVLVDDSLVRGNTARRLVQMLREAGASAVWLRLASAPVAWPCGLGIDTPTREELLINHGQTSGPSTSLRNEADARAAAVEAVRTFVGADDLRYLSREGLARAVEERPMCMACMDGRYPL
jgi:amidophosphoribosyltransferase